MTPCTTLLRRVALGCGLLGLTACASAPKPHPSTPPPAPGVGAAAQSVPVRNSPVPSGVKKTQAAHVKPILDDTPSRSPQVTAEQTLVRHIRAVIDQPRFDHANWGIKVVALNSGRTLYQHHADTLFIPASNTKLYSTSLALHTLGASYRFVTSLYASRPVGPHGVLHGNLVLYGRGDPSLGAGSDTSAPTQWADTLAQAVAAKGIHHIRGNLIGDATYYEGTPVGAGWEANDLEFSYAPVASPLSVQGNTFGIRIAPEHGRCCEVGTQPAETGVTVHNLTHTVARHEPTDLGLHRPPDAATLYVYGGLKAHSGPRSFSLATPDPASMAAGLLRDALIRHGIDFHGHIETRNWPQPGIALDAPGIVHITDIRSPPLRDLVRHTLKDSDNLYAQLLLLAAGKQQQMRGHCIGQHRRPRTTQQWGVCAMRQLLESVGIPAGSAFFDEGSGLSRKDRVTPSATTDLLLWIHRQPFYSAIDAALPVAGRDGTLRYRMRGTATAGNMHAKTGTLRFAYALSGYVTDAAGQPLAFSIMLNGYHRPTNRRGHPTVPRVDHDIDAIAQAIAAFGARSPSN